jgi:hypothetical protein
VPSVLALNEVRVLDVDQSVQGVCGRHTLSGSAILARHWAESSGLSQIKTLAVCSIYK